MRVLQDIYHFRQASDSVATSGQAREAAFQSMAEAGYRVVVNLALHDDPRYSLPDEPGVVRAAGRDYVHIPVLFGSPSRADLDAFMDALDRSRDSKIWVHCPGNMRVAAFLRLYRVLQQGWDRERAFALMATVWKPNAVWAAFIEAQLPSGTDYGDGLLLGDRQQT